MPDFDSFPSLLLLPQLHLHNNPLLSLYSFLGHIEENPREEVKKLKELLGPSKGSIMDGSKDQFKAKRKGAQKTVVRVKVDASCGKQKSEGPPSDSWSWRKYGQKPIKGSPHPRGYYRCSTSKGCSAKKQVERCRTDSSILIITYTSTHNHPGPDDDSLITQFPKEPHIEEVPLPVQEEKQGKEEQMEQSNMASDQNEPVSTEDHLFHYVQSPNITINQEHNTNPFAEGLESGAHGSLSLLLDEEQEPLSYPHLMTFSSATPTSEENDFFDELGELPTPSSFITSFMANNFFDERILVFPS
uniref:WRKY transcription factor 26 n=1 Tax=Santalum album TaxID=35974 RepID=A0A650C2W2_SANAL|nr:WRKY transcription factor 26 [Santalum album]